MDFDEYDFLCIKNIKHKRIEVFFTFPKPLQVFLSIGKEFTFRFTIPFLQDRNEMIKINVCALAMVVSQ